MEDAVKRTIVTAVAVALLTLTSGTASADWSSKTAPARGAFPKYEDPWQHWGKPHPKPSYVDPPQSYHHYVWVQGYWWWNGVQWVWVPGYWRVW
jgi:hypothetical protein